MKIQKKKVCFYSSAWVAGTSLKCHRKWQVGRWLWTDLEQQDPLKSKLKKADTRQSIASGRTGFAQKHLSGWVRKTKQR